MLEPLKILTKLSDKIEKSGMARKRKDFLQTLIVFAIGGYALAFPILVILVKQVADMVEKALGL